MPQGSRPATTGREGIGPGRNIRPPGGLLRDVPSMRYRRLGDSGLTVSVVGLGANNFGNRGRVDREGTRKVIDAAQEAGVTLIDTSDSYGDSEELLGEALEGRREEFVLATKFGSDVRG